MGLLLNVVLNVEQQVPENRAGRCARNADEYLFQVGIFRRSRCSRPPRNRVHRQRRVLELHHFGNHIARWGALRHPPRKMRRSIERAFNSDVRLQQLPETLGEVPFGKFIAAIGPNRLLDEWAKDFAQVPGGAQHVRHRLRRSRTSTMSYLRRRRVLEYR